MEQQLQNLERLCAIARERVSSHDGAWHMPAAWDTAGFGGAEDAARPGELRVNPYAFFLACADQIKTSAHTCRADAFHSPAHAVCIDQIKTSAHTCRADAPITESTIYSILPRAYTAWNHGGNGAGQGPDGVEPGTLFKTILLLPRLRRFGVDILYLLPVFRTGRAYKKGGLGSPYAIRDITRIDENLHDPLLGPCTEELLKSEFRALVESCHALGMRVMVDFAFRTVSRDSVLIADHPDWFYWIRLDRAADFAAPSLPGCTHPLSVGKSTLGRLYRSPDLASYLAAFTPSPRELDAEKWERVRKGDPDALLERIENAFGVTVMPGFSDMLGDRQPPWTDVTYLRYYFDSAPEVRRFLPPGQPPYLMQDGASLNVYHGTQKNGALWEYAAEAMPAYAREYGIDGARIDMAHAMPVELSAEMIRRVRAQRPDFLLWSEELGAAGGGQAERDGFDFISGFSYAAYKRAAGGGFNRAALKESFLRSPIPLAASLETPDTPRIAQNLQNPALVRLLALLNAFMPNAVPCLNCGQELLERQPMNLGLDNDENGRFVLPADDPAYGRLAFFDRCALHWTSPHGGMEEAFGRAAELRARYKGLLRAENFVPQPEAYGHPKLTLLCYRDPRTGQGLLLAANRSTTSRARLPLPEALPHGVIPADSSLAYATGGGGQARALAGEVRLLLPPCGAALVEFRSSASGEGA